MRRFKLQVYPVYILALLLIGIGVPRAADLKDGFLGIPWGTDIRDLPQFVKVSEKAGVIYYGNPNKSYTLFDVDVPYVTFAFHSAKFFAAYVDVASIDVFGKLRQHITQKYGTPRTTLKFSEGQRIYNWKYRDTKIKLKLYENEGNMKLGFYYSPMAGKINKEQREAYPPPRKPIFPLDERRLSDAMEVYGF
ncbi:MAG: hypothetical protein GY850_41450 [bacterium]|nr:hypothetical protein [bacterium]